MIWKQPSLSFWVLWGVGVRSVTPVAYDNFHRHGPMSPHHGPREKNRYSPAKACETCLNPSTNFACWWGVAQNILSRAVIWKQPNESCWLVLRVVLGSVARVAYDTFYRHGSILLHHGAQEKIGYSPPKACQICLNPSTKVACWWGVDQEFLSQAVIWKQPNESCWLLSRVVLGSVARVVCKKVHRHSPFSVMWCWWKKLPDFCCFYAQIPY